MNTVPGRFELNFEGQPSTKSKASKSTKNTNDKTSFQIKKNSFCSGRWGEKERQTGRGREREKREREERERVGYRGGRKSKAEEKEKKMTQ